MNNRQRKKTKQNNNVDKKPEYKSNSGFMMDMFVNAMARTGMSSQNLMNTTDYELTRITKNYQLLTTLYRENWIAKKIINTIPEDMCRNWFEITTEMSPENLDRYEKLEKRTKIKSKILCALYWSRLYGGSAAIMLIDEQDNLSDPLDLDTIMPGAFKGLLIVDRWMGIYPENDLITDINDPDYGLPEYYQVTDNSTSEVVRIHHSRLLRFPGRELPQWEEVAEMYWGASELEHVFEEIAKRDNTSWNIASLVFRASIIATKTDGLDVINSLGDIEVQKDFYNTQQAINTQLNNNSLLLLGAKDELTQLNYTFSGLNDVYESFMLDIAGAAEMPVTKLFGRAPAGLNATGESDAKNYDETIENLQESKLRPVLDQLLPVMFMSEFGMVPDDLDFRFLPIQSPTESELAELVSKKTTSIKDVYDSGIINQRIALQELKAMSDSTGMFTNITDEDIELASTDFMDEKMASSIGFENNNYSNTFGSSTMDGGPGSGRHPEGINVNNKVDSETHQRYNKILNGVKAASGHIIKSTGVHAVERAIERKISPEDIKEALEKAWAITPPILDDKGRPSIKLFGNKAVVAINPDTNKIATVWIKGET